MKILNLSTLLTVAVLSLTACSKQSDPKISDSQTDNNYGNGGFTWTGTAPMSAKIDGQDFLADQVIFSAQSENHFSIMGMYGGGALMVSLLIPKSVKAGQIVNLPDPSIITIASNTESEVLVSTTGKIRIAINNATSIEGHFWADMGDGAHVRDTTVKVTEGYFKVKKQ